MIRIRIRKYSDSDQPNPAADSFCPSLVATFFGNVTYVTLHNVTSFICVVRLNIDNLLPLYHLYHAYISFVCDFPKPLIIFIKRNTLSIFGFWHYLKIFCY